MKRILFIVAIAALVMPVQGKIKHIKPSEIFKMPTDTSKSFDELVEENFIYEDLYSGKCSWYCGGEVDTVTSSSCLAPTKKFDYKGANAHDFNHESVWAEGASGQGIGEYLVYHFKGVCPRITTVKVLNGHVKNEKVWRENSRVKQLKVYFNDTPLCILDLKDSRTLQCFEVGTLGYNDANAPDWTLKFEIVDVYPGTKYQDTVISELYFDGIDVH